MNIVSGEKFIINAVSQLLKSLTHNLCVDIDPRLGAGSRFHYIQSIQPSNLSSALDSILKFERWYLFMTLIDRVSYIIKRAIDFIVFFVLIT